MRRKNILDEMQEQKRLLIESRGLWVALFGLVLVMVVQSANGETQLRDIAGEATVLLALAAYLSPCYIRNGIWSTTLRPTLKTNLIISCVTALAVALYGGILSYVRYGKLAGSLATATFMFVSTSVLTMLLLSLFSWLYKRRIQKLENTPEDVDKSE